MNFIVPSGFAIKIIPSIANIIDVTSDVTPVFFKTFSKYFSMTYSVLLKTYNYISYT